MEGERGGVHGRRERSVHGRKEGRGEVCMRERRGGVHGGKKGGGGVHGGKRGGGGVHERKGVEKKRRQEVTQVHTQLWKEVKREEVHTT